MSYNIDHDGKSKTASAVDQEHYPEQHEVDRVDFDKRTQQQRDQIARRAFELWRERGCPEGSPGQDWLQAEAEYNAAKESQNAVRSSATKGGSVQT